MKKLFSILFVVMTIFAMTFAFCSCSSGVVGEWKATTCTMTQFEGATPYNALEDNFVITLKINNDKTYKLITTNTANPSANHTTQGKWSFEDDKLTLVYNDGNVDCTVLFELKDGILYGQEVTPIDDQITLTTTYVFERK